MLRRADFRHRLSQWTQNVSDESITVGNKFFRWSSSYLIGQPVAPLSGYFRRGDLTSIGWLDTPLVMAEAPSQWARACIGQDRSSVGAFQL